MEQIFEKIKKIAEQGNGIIRTAQIEEAGVNRGVLKQYVDAGLLERVRKGFYTLANSNVDEYVVVQAQSSNGLFSHGTALFFWGLSDRTPHTLDMTVPQGTNVSRFKRNNPELRFHYVMPAFYELGICETISPQGGTVRLYDKERCICDFIRDKEHVEMQLYTQAIKDYFRGQTNVRKMLKYGKVFGIEEKIRTYMEVLL